jgi:hypothetical protein
MTTFAGKKIFWIFANEKKIIFFLNFYKNHFLLIIFFPFGEENKPYYKLVG